MCCSRKREQLMKGSKASDCFDLKIALKIRKMNEQLISIFNCKLFQNVTLKTTILLKNELTIDDSQTVAKINFEKFKKIIGHCLFAEKKMKIAKMEKNTKNLKNQLTKKVEKQFGFIFNLNFKYYCNGKQTVEST